MEVSIPAFFVLIFCSVVGAAPTGNPAFPKVVDDGFFFSPACSFSFRIGYEGIFVTDRRLESLASLSRRINDYKISLNSGIFTLNLLKRLDLFATYGCGRIEAEWINEESADCFSFLKIESKYSWGWSVGTKIIFFEWGNICFSLGGRYFYFDPPLLYLNKETSTYSLTGSKTIFKEWQTDVGFSYKTDFCIPYICAKYSKAKSNLSVNEVVISSDGSNKLKMKGRDNVGMALGCSISSGKYFFLNAEVRLFDEEAFTLSGDFKF